MPREVEIVSCEVVGNRIVEAMDKKALPQEHTARRAGMTTRQLGRIMRQQNCPSLKKAVALSRVLDYPLDRLFQFKIRTRQAMPVARRRSSRRRRKVGP